MLCISMNTHKKKDLFLLIYLIEIYCSVTVPKYTQVPNLFF